ncbi:MAG: AzlC family ABC transporter permease [Clostridia bacterium]|nr:AzlC family ABC transporter permease [Clostridia bacterium]
MKNSKLTALKSAFPHTIPILAGFMFLGMTYGILMKVSGFPIWLALIMSVVVFAGSMQFVGVNILLSPFNPLAAFMMTLMINARHIFYGISMLDKYKNTGAKKTYLIFGMCDESFSINCSAEIPDGVDKNWFMFFVTLLDQLYWVAGTAVGAVFGSFIKFNTQGLDFVMTAMFVVIFLEQLLKEKNHLLSITGLLISIVSLVIFGADNFIIPAMLAILAALTLLRSQVEKREGVK